MAEFFDRFSAWEQLEERFLDSSEFGVRLVHWHCAHGFDQRGRQIYVMAVGQFPVQPTHVLEECLTVT